MRTGELYQRYYGIYLGTVVSTADPQGMGRVRVHMDQYDDTGEPVYAAVARPVANEQTTVFFSPREGDQVIVGFLVGDVNEPIILGYAHSKQKKPPGEVSPPKVHGVVTSIGRVTFDEDSNKIEVIFNGSSPQTGSSITMDSNGLKIHSDVQVVIQAPTGAVNLVAPSLGFAGTPSFVPAAGQLPPADAPPPDRAVMNFPKGLEVETADAKFCVNGAGVVLVPFLDRAFSQHVHLSAAPSTPTGPALMPGPPPANVTSVLITPPQVTRC